MQRSPGCASGVKVRLAQRMTAVLIIPLGPGTGGPNAFEIHSPSVRISLVTGAQLYSLVSAQHTDLLLLQSCGQSRARWQCFCRRQAGLLPWLVPKGMLGTGGSQQQPAFRGAQPPARVMLRVPFCAAAAGGSCAVGTGSRRSPNGTQMDLLGASQC